MIFSYIFPISATLPGINSKFKGDNEQIKQSLTISLNLSNKKKSNPNRFNKKNKNITIQKTEQQNGKDLP